MNLIPGCYVGYDMVKDVRWVGDSPGGFGLGTGRSDSPLIVASRSTEMSATVGRILFFLVLFSCLLYH